MYRIGRKWFPEEPHHLECEQRESIQKKRPGRWHPVQCVGRKWCGSHRSVPLRTPFKEAPALKSVINWKPPATMPLGFITAFLQRSQSPQMLPARSGLCQPFLLNAVSSNAQSLLWAPHWPDWAFLRVALQTEASHSFSLLSLLSLKYGHALQCETLPSLSSLSFSDVFAYKNLAFLIQLYCLLN